MNVLASIARIMRAEVPMLPSSSYSRDKLLTEKKEPLTIMVIVVICHDVIQPKL